ncbi:hypothetical protein ACFLUO_05250 [Chloroflexota bacterium]
MAEIITAVKSLLEVLERMAGGKKRAQIIFYLLLATALGLAIKPIWDNVEYVISKISFASPLANALASIIFLIAGFGALFALITLIAALPAQFMRSTLDTGFRIRLNDTFIALLDTLRKAEKEQLDKQLINQLLNDTETLHAKWIKSKTNVLVGWITPAYFKKDTSKWKLVSIENKVGEKNDFYKSKRNTATFWELV